MLACDLVLQVRASRSLTCEQISYLDRIVFGAGKPSRDNLDLIMLLDRYVQRADPSWGALLARAAMAALVAGIDCTDDAAVPTPARSDLDVARATAR